MSLFTASPKSGAAWVTGASSGIGYALALQLCSEGYHVIATARSSDELQALVKEAERLNGRITAKVGDVTSSDEMKGIISEISSDEGDLALVVLNAGIYRPVYGDKLQLEDFEETFSVNLYGVVNGLLPTIDLMKCQGKGQIAIVSSVTGYGGLPTSAAYGATKAAVINMAESLKFDLDKINIRVQVINPGFVKTAATDQNEFAMPAIVSAKDAAKCISKGLRQDRFEITFPKRFTYVLKLLNLLPYRVYFYLIGKATKSN